MSTCKKDLNYLSLASMIWKYKKGKKNTTYLNEMKVNFSSLRNEQEDSKLIHKTYIKQSTKFGAMVQKELKRDRERWSKTKMPKM